MKFSTKSRYALRLMIELALIDKASFLSLKDISRRQDISVKYLEQIVSQLNRAGLLISTRGSQGGYRLARGAETITAGDILRATEGRLVPAPCLEEGHDNCARTSKCAAYDFWEGLYQTMNNYLDNITLEQLAQAQLEKAGLNFTI